MLRIAPFALRGVCQMTGSEINAFSSHTARPDVVSESFVDLPNVVPGHITARSKDATRNKGHRY